MCLMHRCVCVFDGTYYKITTTNYISKTSPYTTFRTYPSGPRPLKILMFALLVTRQIYVGFVADIDIKILGAPPPPRDRACLSQTATHAQRGGYLFLPGFSSLYDAKHGWMMGRMDEWKASRKTATTSFTMCNPKRLWSFQISPCQCRC